MTSRTRSMIAMLLTIVGVAAGVTGTRTAEASSRTFYVDCSGGGDGKSGTSPSLAWRSVVRANRASLSPGDQLLFKRGCGWSQQRLDVIWSGTSSAPVVIGAYGTGADPILRDGTNSNVKVAGSNLVIRDLNVVFHPIEMGLPTVRTVDGCVQPIGNVYGFNFTDGAHHVVLRSSRAAGFTAGAHLSRQSHHITVLDNLFEKNSIMDRFGGDPTDDLGAWGMNVNADDSEIAYNTFRHNKARCRNQGYKIASNSVELFETQRVRVHHNRSYGDRVFTEMGGSSGDRAADNVLAYNLMDSAVAEARFLVTRGAGSSWGPVWRTVAVHNTVHLTGRDSEGVSCGKGCSSDILTLRSNIIWSEGPALYADQSFDEAYNIFWSTGSAQTIDAQSISNTSRVANPRFVNRAEDNFRLQSSSPGVNSGGGTAGYTTDLAGTSVPQGTKPEIGGFEHTS